MINKKATAAKSNDVTQSYSENKELDPEESENEETGNEADDEDEGHEYDNEEEETTDSE